MKKRKIKVMFSQIIEEVNALREEVAELRVALRQTQTEGEAPEAHGAHEDHDGSEATEAPAPDADAATQAGDEADED